ncbi:MAG: DUF2513 domain-containing protein [Paracoccaceae bacterium]|nr:DUF2513 domain-containing protein [Paracoccaceae bacterium]
MAKRDLNRIRDILLHLEGQESDDGYVWTRGDEFYVASDDYQFTLMTQAGILSDDEYRTMATIVPDRVMITFQGHDYLDAIRDQGVWEKTKAAVAETGGNATLEIVKALALGLLKKKISQHTGIDL